MTERGPSTPWVQEKTPCVVPSAWDRGADARGRHRARASWRMDSGNGATWRRTETRAQLSDLGVSFLFSSSPFPGWVPGLVDPAGSSLLLREEERA